MENSASLEVEIFVQDLAGNKEGKFLALPMKKEELNKALKPFGFEELYKEFINSNGFGTGQILSETAENLTIYEFNDLIKFLGDRNIKDAKSLLFYADGRGLLSEEIYSTDDFDDVIKGLGLTASEILTQVEKFNFSDDYFIIDDLNFIYSVNDYELQKFASERAVDIINALVIEGLDA